ncbi:MAG: hypothetical protein CMF29_04205 [Kiritimatiellaceae bacterium]|nr:hypothetical protein [Kiritimatiellaceae bacterium]
MKKRIRRNILLMGFVLAWMFSAHSFPHEAWNLEGAQDRIERIRKGDAHIQFTLPNGDLISVPSTFELKQLRHAFNFGGSLAADWKVPERAWYPEFKSQFANLFNYATIDFYWAVHSHKQGEWMYQPSSREKLDWAKSQGMRLRGHPLMWHEVIPEWISSAERPVEELDADIISHVKMLVDSYPEIDEWDLHNETPGIRGHKPEMGVRRWVEWAGGPGAATERIVEAVREIRPDGRYILNHFTDADPEYHSQIQYCLSNEVPVDVIGIQTHMHHLGDAVPEDRLWNALNEYEKYGLPLQLSEITVLSCEMFPDWRSAHIWYDKVEAAKQSGKTALSMPSLPAWEEYQAALTRDFYTLAFSHPAVEAIIWWTITDVEPWRGMPAGLLDEQGQPKPVYHVLDELINQEWHTEKRGMLSEDGMLRFRGFYGTYAVQVEYEGVCFEGTFAYEKEAKGVQRVELRAR